MYGRHGGWPMKGSYFGCSALAVLDALKDIGFNALALSNNHAFDVGLWASCQRSKKWRRESSLRQHRCRCHGCAPAWDENLRHKASGARCHGRWTRSGDHVRGRCDRSASCEPRREWPRSLKAVRG
ncbi:MAG: CapA family protein [Shinella sp.]|nr:CapA family protein [Shinella sp.]